MARDCMTNPPDQIRSAVLAALDRTGMSRASLSRRAEIHPSAIGEWLAGRRDLRVSGVERVMRVLGLTVHSP